MKYLFFLIIFLIPIKEFGQSKYTFKQGYRFIEKAEKKLNLNKLEKAEKFLQKAKNSDYGFCGNAWTSAYSEIDLIQVQIYNKKMEYEKALNLLDSIAGCEFDADCLKRDSLKVETLILKFGKEKVRTSFEKITEINRIENEYFTTYYVFLSDLNYKFIFGNGLYKNDFRNGEIIIKNLTNLNLIDDLKQISYLKILE